MVSNKGPKQEAFQEYRDVGIVCYAHSEFVIKWSDLKTVCPKETDALEKAPLWDSLGVAALIADMNEWVEVADNLGDVSDKRQKAAADQYLRLTRNLCDAFKENTGGLVLRTEMYHASEEDGEEDNDFPVRRLLIVDGVMGYTPAGYQHRHIIHQRNSVRWG
jgi:hypothetical protein